MRREDILTMEPGRELDKLVFKFVMGGRIPEPPLRARIMNFSTDISAAWEMEERLLKESWQVQSNYVLSLSTICGWRDASPTTTAGLKLIHASPADRCKAALLAVMDKEAEA